jgi:dolichol kinase
MASFIGRNFGSHKFAIWKNKKTLEGSLAFIIVTWIILFFYLFLYASITPVVLLVITVFAMLLTIIELVTPSFLDNFILLIFGAILLNAF